MDNDLIEKLEARKKLIAIIRDKPGIHFRELFRESALAMGELEYHLDVLEKMEVITKKKSKRYTKYYPSAELSSKDKEVMSVLRQDVLRDILLFIISNERVVHGDIVEEFKIVKSTASFYLNKLTDEGLVEKERRGRNVYFEVIDPENILRLILLYKKGFGEEIARRVEGLWANL